MSNMKKEVARIIKENFLEKGKFKLSNGEESNYYIDFRKVLSAPHYVGTVLDLLLDLISHDEIDPDLVCGVPDGATPWATMIALKTHKPLIMCRKNKKEYGNKGLISGEYKKGQTCLLIDDVVTTGSSIKKTKEILEKEGLKVILMVCLLNRGTYNEVKNVFIMRDFVD